MFFKEIEKAGVPAGFTMYVTTINGVMTVVLSAEGHSPIQVSATASELDANVPALLAALMNQKISVADQLTAQASSHREMEKNKKPVKAKAAPALTTKEEPFCEGEDSDDDDFNL